jgi:hypothetical protein
MRTSITILAATALVLVATGPALAGCGSTQVHQVGAISGEPEKDTLGLICNTSDVERTGSIASRSPGELLQVGMSTGEAEKDTLGYVQTASAQ